MVKVVTYNCSCGNNGYDIIEGKWNTCCLMCGEKQRRYTIKYNPKETKEEIVNITYKENPRYSLALAVNDEQLEAAKKLHPQVSDWKKFGNSWRPLIKNRAEKLKIMKQANFYEFDPNDFKRR